MQTIKLTITIISLIFLLGGCGSGEDADFNMDNTNNSSSSGSKTTIDISSCTSGNTSIKDGDTLVTDDSSSVNISHQSNGTKQICVSTGSAYLVRG